LKTLSETLLAVPPFKVLRVVCELASACALLGHQV